MKQQNHNLASAYFRGILVFISLIITWWLVVLLFQLPHYILPSPLAVARTLWQQRTMFFHHTCTTLAEIFLGLALGIVFGTVMALLSMISRLLHHWLMPILIVSQSIPIFALAPILVLWFGFGMTSKIIITVLVIFFPVTTAFYDGLRRTEPGLLELAQTMAASRWSQLKRVRLVAALPALGSGIRVAATIAPIGAIVGEWVGSSSGLGYVMLNASARLQTPTLFAAVFVLSIITIALWKIVDIVLKKALYWVPNSLSSDNQT